MYGLNLWTPFHCHKTIFGTVYIDTGFTRSVACFTVPELGDVNGKYRLYFNGQSYAVK